MLTALRVIKTVMRVHQPTVIHAIKQITIKRTTRTILQQTSLQLAMTAIQQMDGHPQHSIMTEDISRSIPENIKEHGTRALIAILINPTLRTFRV